MVKYHVAGVCVCVCVDVWVCVCVDVCGYVAGATAESNFFFSMCFFFFFFFFPFFLSLDVYQRKPNQPKPIRPGRRWISARRRAGRGERSLAKHFFFFLPTSSFFLFLLLSLFPFKNCCDVCWCVLVFVPSVAQPLPTCRPT